MEYTEKELKVLALLKDFKERDVFKGISRICYNHGLSHTYSTCLVKAGLLNKVGCTYEWANKDFNPNIYTAKAIIDKVNQYHREAVKRSNEKRKIKDHLKEVQDIKSGGLNSEEKSLLKMGEIMYSEDKGYESQKHYDPVIAKGLCQTYAYDFKLKDPISKLVDHINLKEELDPLDYVSVKHLKVPSGQFKYPSQVGDTPKKKWWKFWKK